MKKDIPFFNYPSLFKSNEKEFIKIFKDVGNRGAYILQKDLEEFEENLAKFTGCKYALGVANGTDAIWLALLAAGIGNGDEVIFASHTYIATAGAIKFVGATPIPADCREDHMIDPKSVEKLITDKTKAIVPTQLNGRCCEMDTLLHIAKKHNLIIIEDAAQGLGAKFKGKGIGTFDKGGTISFYPAKNLGSFGDAGAFVTNDKAMYNKVKLLRDHGRDENGKFFPDPSEPYLSSASFFSISSNSLMLKVIFLFFKSISAIAQSNFSPPVHLLGRASAALMAIADFFIWKSISQSSGLTYKPLLSVDITLTVIVWFLDLSLNQSKGSA